MGLLLPVKGAGQWRSIKKLQGTQNGFTLHSLLHSELNDYKQISDRNKAVARRDSNGSPRCDDEEEECAWTTESNEA
ncbi:hypothetical protein VZT92_015354 [Zoarces viviparus]|uniref:Uncharacterized protein n=1 Tax=Zoarces viviparus TaxID=48416 RepID=A0AAW1EV90_ZOAVI